MSITSRLNRAFSQATVLPLTKCSRYVLVSDCHRGAGTSSDNFLKNQHLYYAALEHYYRGGFTYIELGDGEELWENRKLRTITEIHEDAYCLLARFEAQDRLHLLYGNHNIVQKRNPSYKDSWTSGQSAQLHPLALGTVSGTLSLESSGKSRLP